MPELFWAFAPDAYRLLIRLCRSFGNVLPQNNCFSVHSYFLSYGMVCFPVPAKSTIFASCHLLRRIRPCINFSSSFLCVFVIPNFKAGSTCLPCTSSYHIVQLFMGHYTRVHAATPGGLPYVSADVSHINLNSNPLGLVSLPPMLYLKSITITLSSFVPSLLYVGVKTPTSHSFSDLPSRHTFAIS